MFVICRVPGVSTDSIKTCNRNAKRTYCNFRSILNRIQWLRHFLLFLLKRKRMLYNTVQYSTGRRLTASASQGSASDSTRTTRVPASNSGDEELPSLQFTGDNQRPSFQICGDDLRLDEARLLAHVKQLLLNPKFMRLLVGFAESQQQQQQRGVNKG